MDDSTTSTNDPAPRRKRRRQPTSAYLFLVSSSAVFLVALILGLGFRPRDPVKAIVGPPVDIDRVATRELSAANSARLDQIAESIKTVGTVQEAIDLVSKYDDSPLDAKTSADRFHRDLKVLVRPASNGGQQEIVLDYQGSAAGATEVVNQIAQLAIQQYDRKFIQPARSRQFEAQQEATAAERKYALSKKLWEEYERRWAEYNKQTDATPRPANAANSKSAGQPGEAAMIENPAWRDLANDQRRLASKRQTLLEQMTVEHPVIRQLDIDLAQMDESLSKTPKLIENPKYAQASSPAEEAKAASPLAAENQTPGTNANNLAPPSVDDAPQSPAEASNFYAAKLGVLKAAKLDLEAIQAGRIEVIRWAEKPAFIRGSDGITLIVAALLAWLIGSAVAAHGVPADPTIADADQAASVTGTHVLGVLPANEHSPEAFYPELPRTTHWALRASEIALAAMLFMAVTLVVADDTFRTQLMSHPLSSIPLGIERVQEMMHG